MGLCMVRCVVVCRGVYFSYVHYVMSYKVGLDRFPITGLQARIVPASLSLQVLLDPTWVYQNEKTYKTTKYCVLHFGDMFFSTNWSSHLGTRTQPALALN